MLLTIKLNQQCPLKTYQFKNEKMKNKKQAYWLANKTLMCLSHFLINSVNYISEFNSLNKCLVNWDKGKLFPITK